MKYPRPTVLARTSSKQTHDKLYLGRWSSLGVLSKYAMRALGIPEARQVILEHSDRQENSIYAFVSVYWESRNASIGRWSYRRDNVTSVN